MARLLVIGPAEAAAIAAAIASARAHPVTLDVVKANALPHRDKLKLGDRRGRIVPRPTRPVPLPHGFMAAISFEVQPMGLCKHLSISIDRPGKVPSHEHVALICEAFGITWPPPFQQAVWLEEFAPGHDAVNIVEPVAGWSSVTQENQP